jgi:hypothetical protein
VRPFPDVNGGHWQVSTTGGTRPLWARNGQELVYVSQMGALMRVGVARGPSWAGYNADAAGQGRVFHEPGCFYRPHVRHLTGRAAVLMIKEGSGTDQTAAPPQIIVVQHFDEELKRLVPTK